MPVGFISVDREWRVTYINAAGEAVVGKTREALVGADYWESFPANVDNRFGRTYREVAATGQAQSVEEFYPEPLNQWFEVHAVPTADGLAMYFTEVTERHKAQERLAVLAQVGAELAGALDDDTVINRIPPLITPLLGDGCVLTVVDEAGRQLDVRSWHVDPDRRALLDRYARVRPWWAPTGPQVVTGADVCAGLPPGEARDILATLDFRSVATAPVPGRNRALGQLSVLRDGRDMDGDADLLTLTEVADRIGLALDNVRLFSQQRQLAEGLQRSLLTAPFEPEGAEVVVRYLPAAEAARVGGDWYDAFLQPCGFPMLVIGDVVGHDTAAAAAMGQLRALLRGIAVYSDESPAEVLRGLDVAMSQLGVRTYATAAVVRFEQTDEEAERGVTRMRGANAGHLAPLVIHPDGRLAAPADWRGDLLLGVDSGRPRHESEMVLARGTTVVLFTDGLVERRDGDLDSGMAALRAAAAELADRPLTELCDELLQRLVDGRPEDDVALVALRLAG